MSSAGASQSTDPLTAALQDFQNSLTAQQKADFFASSGGSSPDTNAVLVFTAQIDVSSQRRTSRCLASRMQGFLTSVEQFSQVFDTFIQSNPKIAALVWGSLRFTIVLASNFSSFFDKLSRWFMQVQTYCPRFKEYEALFPNSVRLQEALCRFYATMIGFCTEAVSSLTKTSIMHFAKTCLVSFEQQFGAYTSKLQTQYSAVKDEIRLASDQSAAYERQLQTVERREAKKARSLSRILHKDILQFTDESREWRLGKGAKGARKQKQSLLDKLSDFDYMVAFKREKRKRYGATSLWLSDTLEFRSWLNEPKAVFWLSGIMGSGKTITTTAVIDTLLTRQIPESCVAFFFCQHDNARSLRARTVLCSLARQLLTVDSLSSEIEELLTVTLSRFSVDPESLQNTFAAVMEWRSSVDRDVRVVIDGFDEMAYEERSIVLHSLRALWAAGEIRVGVFLSSREDAGYEIRKTFSPPQSLLSKGMSCTEAYEDITTYVRCSLEERLIQGDLSFTDDNLIKEVEEALINGANGMFLRVFFQIEEICVQKTDDCKRTALAQLPRDLPETYQRALARVAENRNDDVAYRMLLWAMAAKRPLSLLEMREAIAIKFRAKELRESQMITEINRMVSWCGNILILDEEDQVVQFAHHSVKDFIVSRQDLIWNKSAAYVLGTLGEFDVENYATMICRTYLNFDVFSGQLTRLRATSPSVQPLQIAARHVMAYSSSSLIKHSWSRLEKYLRSQRDPNLMFNITEALTTRQSDTASSLLQLFRTEHPFLAYASEYWLDLVDPGIREKEKAGLGIEDYSQWQDLVLGDKSVAVKPWSKDEWYRAAPVVLDFIADHDHCALFQVLLYHQTNLMGRWTEVHYRKEVALLCIMIPRSEKVSIAFLLHEGRFHLRRPGLLTLTQVAVRSDKKEFLQTLFGTASFKPTANEKNVKT